MPPPKDTRVQLMMSQELADDLRDLSHIRRESASSIIRAALSGHIKRAVAQIKSGTSGSERLIERYRRSDPTSDRPVRTFSISNSTTGVVLGTYAGEDERAALDSMARDAGYPDHAAACRVAPVTSGELVLRETFGTK